jgi:hypothetical protein
VEKAIAVLLWFFKKAGESCTCNNPVKFDFSDFSEKYKYCERQASYQNDYGKEKQQ